MGKRLNLKERVLIFEYRRLGASCRTIAKNLNRSVSTIIDELNRNAPYVDRNTDYITQAHAAQAAYEARRSRASSRMRLKNEAIQQEVIQELKKGRTPEIISGCLKLTQPDLYVCHESIYQWIYECRRDLMSYLPVVSLRSRRRQKRSRERRSRRKEPAAPKRSISERPAAINKRLNFGHWEGDLVEGNKRNLASDVVLSLIERKSRKRFFFRLPNKEAVTIYRALKAFFEELPLYMRKSLTLDNGSENALHQQLSQELGIDIYFCHANSSWEKGQVENSNGKLRLFFPKGMSASLVTPSLLSAAERYWNNRPMKCLGFVDPSSVFKEALLRSAH